MKAIDPGQITGDSLIEQYRIAIETKEALLQKAEQGSTIHLDLRDCEWLVSTFLVPISVLYNTLSKRDVDLRVTTPAGGGVGEYLQQIDFPSGSNNPSTNYSNHLPLFFMEREADADAIEVVGTKIRELLRKQFSEYPFGVLNAVQYPVDELINNVDEHSEYEYSALLAQHFPNKECLDICIADDGISIPGRYEADGIDFSSDEEAIRMAMSDGVSTSDDGSRHRGYGLRTTTDMICEGLNGEVLLASRGETMRRTNRGPFRSGHDLEWDGTVFAARLHLPSDRFDYMKYLH